MIHSISTKFADYLIQHSLPIEKREIYIYGAECFFNLLISDSILLIYAILTHQPMEFLLWLVSFSLLRTHIGGYHASTHASCIISGIVLGIFCLQFHHYLCFYFPISIILLCVSFAFICKYAPVCSSKHPLSAKQQKKEKKVSIVCFLIEILLALVLKNIYLYYCTIIICGILVACFFSYIGFLQYKKTN
ncbi:MAG: accessory gene regulator B family protein [Lachnospiraceae bacterium]|nr:accessory gene regulator B family protein [Lachnospiraceae bacterium]